MAKCDAMCISVQLHKQFMFQYIFAELMLEIHEHINVNELYHHLFR